MSTFTHHNKLTIKVASKLLITLNQALIYTPIPNLMGVIQFESMISQTFQPCYSVEGCPSDCCILSFERIEYMVENIYQLNLSPRSPLICSRELHLQPQELLKARAQEALSIDLHSEKYIRIVQMLEIQLKRNRKGNSLFYHSLSHVSPL